MGKLPSSHQAGCTAKHYSPGSELRQGFRSLWLVILFHIFAFLALAPSFLGLFIQGLEQRISSGVSAETSFTGRGGRKLEDLVPHSASVPSTFLLLVLPLCPPPTIPVTPESVELQDYFAWNFFCNEMTFMSLLVHLILDWCAVAWGKMEQGDSGLSLAYNISVSDLRLNSFIFDLLL